MQAGMGKGTVKYDANIKKILQRAQELNLKLRPNNNKFRLDQSVGHLFTKGGRKPDEAKATAGKNTPTPDIRRFLGMINYLHKFFRNF